MSSQHTHSETSGELTFTEKSAKRLSHWIQHNEDHAQNYRQWAAEFDQHQLPQVKTLLESAANLTEQINKVLDEALRMVQPDL